MSASVLDSAQDRAEPAASAGETGTRGTGRWQRGAGVLAATGVAIGAANYGSTLLFTRVLDSRQFSLLAAGQSVLLVLGTASMAALPWAVSHYLVDPAGERSRAKAMYFGVVASTALGLALGAAACAIGWATNGPLAGATIGLAVLFICQLAAPIGFFQGGSRYTDIAAMRVIEVVVRIAIGFGLVLGASRSATAGLVGFPVGGAASLAFGLWRARDARPWARLDRPVVRALVRQAVLLGAVQVLLAMIGALDTVYVAGSRFAADDTAAYQSAALIGRVPLFLSAALCTAAYTALVTARDDREVGSRLRSCLRTYGWLGLPFALACVTVPKQVLFVVVPARYTDAPQLLRLTAVLGLAIGALNILTTAFQARRRFRRVLTGLGLCVGGQAVLLTIVARTGTDLGFAVAAAAVGVVACVLLAVEGRAWLTLRVPARPASLGWLAVIAALCAVVLLVDVTTVVWVAEMAVLAVLCLLQLREHRPFGSIDTAPRHRR